MCALAKDPAARFGTARIFAEAYRTTLLVPETYHAAQPTVVVKPIKALRKRQRNVRPLAVAVVIAAMLVPLGIAHLGAGGGGGIAVVQAQTGRVISVAGRAVRATKTPFLPRMPAAVKLPSVQKIQGQHRQPGKRYGQLGKRYGQLGKRHGQPGKGHGRPHGQG